MKPSSEAPHTAENSSDVRPVGLRRLSYQAQREIFLFVEGLSDGSSRVSVEICAGLKKGEDLAAVAAERNIEVEKLRTAQKLIQGIVQQTGGAEDLVKNEIMQRLGRANPVAVPETVDGTSASRQPETPTDELRQFITQFSREKVLGYLGIDRDNPQQVNDLVNRYQILALQMEHGMTMLAEKYGCSVEDMRKATNIVLKGGTVVRDHLQPKKVVVRPETDPRKAKTVLIRRPDDPVFSRLKKKIEFYVKGRS